MTFLILLIFVLPVAAQELDLNLIHRRAGEEVARSTLRLDGQRLTGELTGGGVVVKGELSFDQSGMVRAYKRTTRRDGRLVSSVSLRLRSDGSGYTLRESRPLGGRSTALKGGRVKMVLDAAWPDCVIPVLSKIDAGRVPLADLARESVVLGDIRPRDHGARYLDIPGGGPTLELDDQRGFSRLLLPGDERLTVTVRGEDSGEGAEVSAPAGIMEQEVTLSTGLGATLSLPRSREGALPGVVLVTDAGARDRDGVGEGLLSALVRHVAWELADGGVAVVRFDPRDPRDGVGLDTLRRDIRAAGEWLSARQDVDAGRIAVIGHGQGALLGVLAAKDRPDLFRAIVGLAPPARPLREAMVARLRARLRANALSAEAMDAAEQRLNEELDALRDGTESGAQRLMRELLPRIPSDDYLGTKAQLLLLFGARDEEIPPGHRGLLQTAVALYGGKNVDLQVIPGADHEFLERDGGRGSSGAADLARRRHPSLIPVIRSFLETALAKKR